MSEAKRYVLIGAITLIGVLTVLGMASAEITYLGQFGGLGSAWGQFTGPSYVCVDPDTFEVYVTEYGISHGTHYDRVQRFDREGNFINGWVGPLVRPSGVAMHNGDVYVVDHWHHRVVVFTPSGSQLRTYGSSGTLNYPAGIAIAPDGRSYVGSAINESYGVAVYSADGSYMKTFARDIWNLGVKLGPDGCAYVGDRRAGRMLVYDADGVFLRVISFPSLTEATHFTLNAKGDIYVSADDNLYKFSNDGMLLEPVMSPGTDTMDIAVADTGEFWLVDPQEHVVRRFFDSEAWVSGENHFAEAAVGPGELLGASQLLAVGKSLVVDGNTTVMGGGILEVRGGTFATGGFVQEAGSTLMMEIGDGALDNALIGCSSFVRLGGTLEVTLADGFTPELGDRLLLFEAAAFGGSFDNVLLPALPGGLYLDVHALTTDGTLRVVPEPGTLWLASLAACMIVRCRRRPRR